MLGAALVECNLKVESSVGTGAVELAQLQHKRLIEVGRSGVSNAVKHTITTSVGDISMMCTLAAQLGSSRNAWQSPTGHDLIIFMVVDLIGSNKFLGVSLAPCGLECAQESGILSDVP